MPRITHRNMWNGFGTDSIYIRILNDTKTSKTISLESIFMNGNRLKRVAESKINDLRDFNKIRIWVTGENLLPPTKKYDLSFSFYPTQRFGKVQNIYFPLYMDSIDWFGVNYSHDSSRIAPKYLIGPMKVDEHVRMNRCIAFIGNMTNRRKDQIEMIRGILPVDLFGSSVGKYVEKPEELARQYKFLFCPENEIVEGYVTEKLFNSRKYGCIPLYEGGLLSRTFNTDAVISLGTEIDQLECEINEIIENYQKYREYIHRPLMRNLDDFQRIKNEIFSYV